jgi:hypothetical protein
MRLLTNRSKQVDRNPTYLKAIRNVQTSIGEVEVKAPQVNRGKENIK